ncbi:unnamed protein product [Owenia fusiformis]|uniref:RCR-type E3 ubiquitin transferase n=1 Tax=Owenia fusiformis TaxID=6347 RepID=A0A8S4N8G5_OWEFU|nr:unnamed protein product [Owenia fusiformis]
MSKMADIVPLAELGNRTNLENFLQGDRLEKRFLQLFVPKDTPKKKEKKKTKKKNKKTKEKLKSKRDKVFEDDQSPLIIEVPSNPSTYAVYASVRQAVLENQIKETTKEYLASNVVTHSDSDSDEDEELADKSLQLKIPKIVGIGLSSVFELIHETKEKVPTLCTRALQALLDMLQGQTPEGLKPEPVEVIDSLFDLLLELAKTPLPNSPVPYSSCDSMTSLACSALLSLVIARGDTGKLMCAISEMLMSSNVLASQTIKVPCILTSLQKSVQAVLLGKTQHPEWLTQGIKLEAKTGSFLLEQDKTEGTSSITSDGRYIYIFNKHGLTKVGSGYGGTIKGKVCKERQIKENSEGRGWIAHCKGKLFYRQYMSDQPELKIYDAETLEPVGKTRPEISSSSGNDGDTNVMFCNGEVLGHIAIVRDDYFLVRTFDTTKSPMPVISEIPLKLARKCLDVFGTASYDSQTDIHTLNTGYDEDSVNIAGGKDFCFIRTGSGKLLYTGKAASLGIKQGGPAAEKWAELPITKSPKIIQFSVGHEGQHALLVGEDGSVFFVGTPRRGEDGDSSMTKARKQAKPVKPKKMIRMENKSIIQTACNNGTSALITKEGEVYMFGKDTCHCDHASGHVTDLKDLVVTYMSLGKAHAVALTNKGHIYTFGINNKGQCGREFVVGASREVSNPVTMLDEEEVEIDDSMCPPGKHKWKSEACLICSVCGECTGYGTNCISSGRPDRNPGTPCGCGSGDSGCTVCGACRTCAGESLEKDREGMDAGLLEIFAKSKDMIPIDLLMGRHGARNFDQLSRKLEERRQLIHQRAASKKNLKDQEAEVDHAKIVSLPPAQITLGDGKSPCIQIACGLQHTVALLENGDVYTWGSNQYGQLGLTDFSPRGVPTKVKLDHRALQIAAGSTHTVVLSTNGNVYTFGNHTNGQLGRSEPTKFPELPGCVPKALAQKWHAYPALIQGIGHESGRRATWIAASGDQTFLRIDESLINVHVLTSATVFANTNCIGIIPGGEYGSSTIKCLTINNLDGNCRSFNGPEQADLANASICFDPVFDTLWAYSPINHEVSCYNVISPDVRKLHMSGSEISSILSPELAVPVRMGTFSTRAHAALHMLACLDTLTTAQQLNLSVYEEDKEKRIQTKTYSKEDYAVVNRFESHGGGWGYSGHSIEAIRFMADSDVLLGGFGLFGGRGEYFGKIKLYELGPEGGEHETDGELLAETEEVPYECGAREKFSLLFEEPVLCQTNHWYVAWARVSGPSSDCGSSGQSTITTEDQVVFKMKSSKKSNNGTDVNAGQIPQLLYRLPSNSSQSPSRKAEQSEPAHVLSREFSRTVSPECFSSLLNLLEWGWRTFKAALNNTVGLKGDNLTAAILDLERLVYVCMATLRLLRIYTCEVYPNGPIEKKTPADSIRKAECVYKARGLLKKILSEGMPPSLNNHTKDTNLKPSDSLKAPMLNMASKILQECHKTFTACFHAFYPTGELKWICLCDLLNSIDPYVGTYHVYNKQMPEKLSENDKPPSDRLLSAFMEALCQPTVKLTSILPINCHHETELILKKQFGSPDDNTNSSAQSVDQCKFLLLTSIMRYNTQMEGVVSGNCSFKEFLDKLLTIAVLPVRQALYGEPVTYPESLVSNTCSLIAAVVSELSAAATGSEGEIDGQTRPLLTTPNRYTRTTQNKYWNTGGGSPDAVAFTVDRSGIMIAGVCVYGGGGSYDYQLELLDDQSSGGGDSFHSQKWNNIESIKGSYGPDDLTNDVAELKFEKPVPIREGVRYAVRFRNYGDRTLNGDSGLNKVKGPDGTTFSFFACSLSTNGTNHTRGQIPQLLYYSAPQEGENQIQNSKVLAEFQSRKNAVGVASSVIRAVTDLLHRANTCSDEIGNIIGGSHIFSSLLPLVLAYIGPVASQDPRCAVQVLSLVQEMLPPIAELNSQLHPILPGLREGELGNGNGNGRNDEGMVPHYAMVESDHPYKPATVANYKVTFPDSVKWLSLEFDPQCGTAQNEDILHVSIPSNSVTTIEGSTEVVKSWNVMRKLSGTTNWPQMAVILAGNEVSFSLETASDYVKDEKACFYGFRCAVVGYEWTSRPEDTLSQLEKEVSYLGGMCASALIRKDIILPPASVDEMDEDLDIIEEGAQEVFQAHSHILSKGFALSHPPTISQALEGSLPFSWQSNERSFLKDFVACAPGTSGGRLAGWLQPDSYLDPKQCNILYNKDELKCGWPAVITVQTKDQYGELVHVPNLRVEVKAVPIDQDDDQRKIRRMSRPDDHNLTFGGHPAPDLSAPYQVTLKDRKVAFHSICMMKQYENYSFEELRFAAPAVRRPSENMLVRPMENGTYSSSWTPGSVGYYNIHVNIDGMDSGEIYKVHVKEPPQGVAPPTEQAKKPEYTPSKMRKFVAQYSAGLRIRVNPSLQSEQVGIIKPNGVIGFIDELHNDDGVWLRLLPESIKKWCTNGHCNIHEAWALQYNQHLGKTLLVPVEEPKSILDEIIKETILRRLPEIIRDKSRIRKGGPGNYHVVKCGSSGHNIRCRPNLKATPIGMMVLGNQVMVTEEMTNADGTWVKLDKDAMLHYCHETEGEAWSLARAPDPDLVYLQHELDINAEITEPKAGPFSFGQPPLSAPATSQTKGFDFTTATSSTAPSFGFASQPQLSSQGDGPVTPPGGTSSGSKFVFGNSAASAPGIPQIPAFGQFDTKYGSGASFGSSFGESDHETHKTVRFGLAEDFRSPSIDSPRFPGSASPSEHSFSSSPRKGSSSESPLFSPRGTLERQESLNSDLPPELQGVSVKELVKALGESRANGNGATPPMTPPGTPKKSSRNSSPRSSSPMPIQRSPRSSMSALPPGSPRREPFTSASPRRESPLNDLNIGSPRSRSPGLGSGRSSPVRLPGTPPQRKDSGTFSTPPQTPPLSRRDLHTSPRFESPTRSPNRMSGSPSKAVAIVKAQEPGPPGQPGHFSIGSSSPKEEAPLRMSPKLSRKDSRRSSLRSRRDRTGSPSTRGHGSPATRSRSGSFQKEAVKEALSPSSAECMRAVFAAFLWHEGIVHDAMACASFLKFHPNLKKEFKTFVTKMKLGMDERRSSAETVNQNLNKVQALKNQDRFPQSASDPLIQLNKERHKSESHISRVKKLEKKLAKDGTKDSKLPPTLQHLVSFWEEMSESTMRVIEDNIIMPSPAVNAKISKRIEKKDNDAKNRDKKARKKKDKPGNGLRGNLFGEAAGGMLGNGRETICELCGGSYPHPVTYHMRQSHAGCGHHAGGQGYNSSGNYCDGWAGNCGDGGIGGSSWYLLCKYCRDKYIREKKQTSKEKVKKVRRKSSIQLKQSPVTPNDAEPHIIMKNNALFLLELASASGISLPVSSQQSPKHPMHPIRQDSGWILPSVNELESISENCPFQSVPFLYLVRQGAHNADSAFADEVIVDGARIPFKRSDSIEGQGHQKRSSVHGTDLSHILHRGMSVGSQEFKNRSCKMSKSQETPPPTPQDGESVPLKPLPKSAGTSPEEPMKKVIFTRSVSEYAENNINDNNRPFNPRRRNNSGGAGDGGLSLLKNPSAAMTKLIEGSTDKGPARGDQNPVMAFIVQRHNLDALQLAMRQGLRKAACRVHAFQAMNWLIRSITQTSCFHDLFWFFVSALMPLPHDNQEETDVEKDGKEKQEEDLQMQLAKQPVSIFSSKEDKDVIMCEHPLSDITIAGEAVNPLPAAFHTLLQTIADVMMHLPASSGLQQMAVRCYCLKFNQADHSFLHKSHVFSNISKILSKSDEEGDDSSIATDNAQNGIQVHLMKDLMSQAVIKASSRQAMIASLTDNTTETFWESGDEDRNKTKSITITFNNESIPKIIYVHIDNSRDLANKVTQIGFHFGMTSDDMTLIKQVDLENRFTGWVSCNLCQENYPVLKLTMKGPDNSLRVRQVKILGQPAGENTLLAKQLSDQHYQKKNCESETLKVFRLLTSQVFGKLIPEEAGPADVNLDDVDGEEKNEGEIDLKEHMVGILFSRSKLTHLQKQVCAHIVQAIRKETQRVQEEWEALLTTCTPAYDVDDRSSDSYCFELLSMVLALSGSGVGRKYIAQQHDLLTDLLNLLHTATPRIQRQVTSLLRRVLPDVSPHILANVLQVQNLPPRDYSIISDTSKAEDGDIIDPKKAGILDVFLAVIAKALTVQMKVKGGTGGKGVTSVTLNDCLATRHQSGNRWFLKGTMSTQQATSIVTLLKDMAAGKLAENWATVTKGAIAEAILNLTKLEERLRTSSECIKVPTMWLALASLCVLEQEHVERLSSGQWVTSDGERSQSRPTCDNHDDGLTPAIILCNDCGNLCTDCDKFLHLHSRTKSHQRQVFKEEEEAIKVDLHEGCGRTKLFWIMALADSNTLKALVEFKEGAKSGKPSNTTGVCRFCGTSCDSGLVSVVGCVCQEPECQENAKDACVKTLPCGHRCGGIKDEMTCLACLHGCTNGHKEGLKQDADDMCMICFTEALSSAPAIQLHCGHVFHKRCCERVLESRWSGPRITFGFSHCPICKGDISHKVLSERLRPIQMLFEDVKRKALMRLEYEGLHKAEAITTPGTRFYKDPAGYAMDRYAYYVCFKCKKAYYGGEARCDEQLAGDDYNPAELVCGGCSDVSRAQMCPKHGTDFLEYKCRYCCSVAVFFCFGTTHFCNPCHDDFQRVTNMHPSELPHCPAGPRGKQLEVEECPLHVDHPPTGEEFALGCGVCRNAHTF